MKTLITKTSDRYPIAQEIATTGGTIKIKDNRPATIVQRKLMKTINEYSEGKSTPFQRKAPQGSSRFKQIATSMGTSYGVDTSTLKATHNSSFPGKLNAEATIQGSNIHFGPGMDTDHNIRHEVAHAIDNAINGVPKGDQVINGQKIDTTRENVVDKMANKLERNRHNPSYSDIAIKSFSKGPLQLRKRKKPTVPTKISKNRLNVVGEDHAISNVKDKKTHLDRRRDEKEFFRQKTNSADYWEEQEFVDKKGEFVDNINYKFGQGFSYLFNVLDNLSDCIAIRFDDTTRKDKQKLENISKSAIFILSIMINDKYKRIVKEKDRTELIYMLDDFLKIHDILEKKFKGIEHLFTPVILKDKKNIDALKGTLKWPMDNKDRIEREYMLNGKTTNEINKLRSLAMLNGANKMYKTKGVWKVGDNHVKEMRGIVNEIEIQLNKKVKILFNLVSKEEFEDEFYKQYPQYKEENLEDHVIENIKLNSIKYDFLEDK